MTAVPTAPAALEPDDCDPTNDYLTEHQLRALGIDPDAIRVLAPHATELCALDGSRCWAVGDLAPLLEGN